ncbi:tRNA (guanosine(46)-N7)-methyltransferase TrmB [Planococcus salinarum]|uniref:tRNA (guanine-N(7)-)-methyltransferase n=1 Tax=Planococcus salinarum TaxID=622695 RepID=A0ABX3D181_9BACL|nr:tRNA (guanosine(46)-N7)-methyltransferase TrmB [Planococcus salinarum]OHX51687.1 tRNA (guanosine(46)-N7)-methyltransferase TrmB [Planococcus salinarum]TAA69776.1 tRNA (guanosine(46)-N7)-methyltransferase TrmB [Planococcus salinarum]
MRARYKPWAAELIEAHPEILIPEPATLKGKWQEEFGNSNPLHIEAGSGKGRFITGLALANPDINYIGIELFDSVIVMALQTVLEQEGGIPNLRLLRVNAQEMESFFEKNEVDRMYLNFSDPWPKTRHAKRRLTHESFLRLYETVLPKNGEIHFKTDNRGLFEYSLTSISEYGMLLKDVSLDLHANEPEWNIMTEYEEKFMKKGQPIYRMEAQYNS